MKLFKGQYPLTGTCVDLLLPSVVSRLNLLHERGLCDWISKSILPLFIHVHSMLQRAMNNIGYVEIHEFVKKHNKEHRNTNVSGTNETKSNGSGSSTASSIFRITSTLIELEHTLANLITRMSTKMIASIPVSRSERGKASLWLESNLFSGGILSISTPKYEIVVEGHESLGLWLSDPPIGTYHDAFVPYVRGFRRNGARREKGLLEKTERVRAGHQLVGIRSLNNSDSADIDGKSGVKGGQEANTMTMTTFDNLEHVYRLLKTTSRPMILTFHTMSTIDKIQYDDVIEQLNVEGRGSSLSSSTDSSGLRSSSADRWRRVLAHAKETGSAALRNRAQLFEQERVEFCRNVALDEKSTVVKYLMKNIKLKGKGKFYCLAWRNTGMYRRHLQPKLERALCAALLKHSGLWYYLKYQQHFNKKIKELTLLVECMSNSFQELKKRMELVNKINHMKEQNSNVGDTKHAGLESKESTVVGETKRLASLASATTDNYGSFVSLIDTLDMTPLYVDAQGILEEQEEAADVDSRVGNGSSGRSNDTNEENEIPLSIGKYFERCMFMIDVVPVRVTPDEDDELIALRRAQDNDGTGSNNGSTNSNGENEDQLPTVVGLRTASSVRSIMSDPELGANIGHANEMRSMIMYQERFGQCIEYAFEEAPSVDPLSLLNIMQVRERRAYSRSFGQRAMAALIGNMTLPIMEYQKFDEGGLLIHRYVKFLLQIRSSFRGVTLDEARVHDEAWQGDGKWENHTTSFESQNRGSSGGGGSGDGNNDGTNGTSNNTSNTGGDSSRRNASASFLWKQHTERLHHYTTSLWSGGGQSMESCKNSFEMLFQSIVQILTTCLKHKKEYGKSREDNLNLVICGCLTSLALDYEITMDSTMILKSTLVDILHQGFDLLHEDDTTGPAMWTLYRFIMMLCMGSSRGEHDGSVSGEATTTDSSKSNSGNINNSGSLSKESDKKKKPTLSSSRSLAHSDGGSSLNLKRQTSGNSSNAFIELNAGTKLRNKLLNFLTSELKVMIDTANDQSIAADVLKRRYGKTYQILTFLVGKYN